MDKARQRFKNNVELLTKHDPALAVMGDREWTAACENPFIQKMAKKLWLYDYGPDDIRNITKAVKGYLKVLDMRSRATPVTPGSRVVKGEITSVKKSCDHENCTRHWFMNVKDEEHNNTIYTPLLAHLLPDDPKTLIGCGISFYAHISVSDRDRTFGFAHRPKLITIKENQNAG